MDEKELEKILKALANKRRLLMLKILKSRRRVSMGTMANIIKLSFRSTSTHFSILYAADLVDREQDGLSMYYSLSLKPHKAVSSVLSII